MTTASGHGDRDATRPFRFGVLIHTMGTRHDWLDKARRIEDLGYATFLMPDHLNEQFGAIPALAAAAAVTSTLRIGTIVLANDYRHPAVLAKDAATLDVLSDGRFELGIGAGWSRRDYEQAGIPFDSAPVRLDRLEESIQLFKAMFVDGPVNHTGRYYTVTGLEGTPKPVQQPHPPILVGGGGRRVLSLAARVADIVSLAARASPEGPDWTSVTEAATDAQLAWIRQAAGDRFDRFELNLMVYALAVTDDRAAAARQTAARWGLSEAEVLSSPHGLIGTAEQISANLRRIRARYGVSYAIIPEIFAEAFAPVVARLAGE